ncbi:MAG: sulfatase-like hydrolase/transferase, partial [Pseudomonadota bacterium]
GTPESISCSANFGPDWYGPYMGFDHVEMMLVGHNWFLPEKPPKGQHYERWYYADGRGDARNMAYRGGPHSKTAAAQTWHSELPSAWHNSTWTADRAIDWLKNRSNTPFCAWVSFPDPHHPFDAPEPWSRLHNPAEVDLPPHRHRDLDHRPWWHKAALDTTPKGPKASVEIRENYSRIPPQSDEQLREIIANTYGQIALIDHNVGRILIALAEAGLDRNTYVFYISDHGDWLGDHGLVLKGPMPYEGLLRVPMIVRGPGIAAGQSCAEPVSTMDLASTFCQLAGAEPGLTQHGSSLVPFLQGKSEERAFAMSEWELLPARIGVGLSLRTVRTKTHKLTVELQTGDGEMYDLSRDPHEMENIFGHPAAAAMQQELMDYIATRPDDAMPVMKAVGMA